MELQKERKKHVASLMFLTVKVNFAASDKRRAALQTGGQCVPFIVNHVKMSNQIHKPDLMAWTQSNVKGGLTLVPLTFLFTSSQKQFLKRTYVHTLAKLM